jgi:pimeloyl-ACP methyl ester carboxylesterase
VQLPSISIDVGGAIRAARSFLRPIGWRGVVPAAAALEGCLLFDRDRRATSFDGTELAYTVVGARGPWVVLVPGFGCPDNFWKYLLPELATRYRVIVYDLRGLGMSGMPRAAGYRARHLKMDDFTIEHHARDLTTLLDAKGADRASLIGHSMGGQIIIEAYRQIPERVSSLTMLTAPYESPTRTMYGRDLDAFFRVLQTTIRALPRPAVLLWRSLFLANPELSHRAAQFARALGPQAKTEDMASYYRHLAFLDPLILMKMADAMRAYSGADVLPTINVPTLIVAGTVDTFTPPRLAKTMHRAIPDSEILFLEDASHGAVIEYPDEVNEAVGSFLDRHVLAERALRSVEDGGATSSRGTPAARD